ncbi:hypothetical protein GW17_00032805 [Ensete ventricosum]|nr:hypothetical protein GW17_00032805 [Ensete ventricosum]RZR89123.1 hypothetical protein BHM03_00016793 [Ensete ventricosum]
MSGSFTHYSRVANIGWFREGGGSFDASRAKEAKDSQHRDGSVLSLGEGEAEAGGARGDAVGVSVARLGDDGFETRQRSDHGGVAAEGAQRKRGAHEVANDVSRCGDLVLIEDGTVGRTRSNDPDVGRCQRLESSGTSVTASAMARSMNTKAS